MFKLNFSYFRLKPILVIIKKYRWYLSSFLIAVIIVVSAFGYYSFARKEGKENKNLDSPRLEMIKYEDLDYSWVMEKAKEHYKVDLTTWELSFSEKDEIKVIDNWSELVLKFKSEDKNYDHLRNVIVNNESKEVYPFNKDLKKQIPQEFLQEITFQEEDINKEFNREFDWEDVTFQNIYQFPVYTGVSDSEYYPHIKKYENEWTDFSFKYDKNSWLVREKNFVYFENEYRAISKIFIQDKSHPDNIIDIYIHPVFATGFYPVGYTSDKIIKTDSKYTWIKKYDLEGNAIIGCELDILDVKDENPSLFNEKYKSLEGSFIDDLNDFDAMGGGPIISELKNSLYSSESSFNGWKEAWVNLNYSGDCSEVKIKELGGIVNTLNLHDSEEYHQNESYRNCVLNGGIISGSFKEKCTIENQTYNKNLSRLEFIQTVAKKRYEPDLLKPVLISENRDIFDNIVSKVDLSFLHDYMNESEEIIFSNDLCEDLNMIEGVDLNCEGIEYAQNDEIEDYTIDFNLYKVNEDNYLFTLEDAMGYPYSDRLHFVYTYDLNSDKVEFISQIKTINGYMGVEYLNNSVWFRDYYHYIGRKNLLTGEFVNLSDRQINKSFEWMITQASDGTLVENIKTGEKINLGNKYDFGSKDGYFKLSRYFVVNKEKTKFAFVGDDCVDDTDYDCTVKIYYGDLKTNGLSNMKYYTVDFYIVGSSGCAIGPEASIYWLDENYIITGGGCASMTEAAFDVNKNDFVYNDYRTGGRWAVGLQYEDYLYQQSQKK